MDNHWIDAKVSNVLTIFRRHFCPCNECLHSQPSLMLVIRALPWPVIALPTLRFLGKVLTSVNLANFMFGKLALFALRIQADKDARIDRGV